ncbi:helix-turn-helix domain-containing protein [Lactobacillus sp. PSON]|uniref:helix-turn-helix domain-containing protein n=1 Tax=Lactobacillus sp. PSON TaxID=3455454 RepID=UPI004040EFAC
MTKNRIKKIRLKNKIDQQELANALSLTQQAISQYENGKREPKLETWQKLADYFGVTVPYLQGFEPDFSEVTDDTKNTLFDLLDKFCLEASENWDKDSNEGTSDEYKSVVLYEWLEEFLVRSKSKEKLKNKNNQSIFKKYFSFLLNDKRLVRLLNQLKYTPSDQEQEAIIKEIKSFIIPLIDTEMLASLKTDIGIYYRDKYMDRLKQINTFYNNALLLAMNEDDAEDFFDSYIEDLENNKKHFLQDIKDGKVKEFIENNKNASNSPTE